METAARTPADARHKEPAPVEPLVAGPTIDTDNTTATGQGQTSAGYLQTARETLASIAGTVQNAVGIETPASTLHNLAENTKVNASVPSSETSGAKPGERVGGVGALPGDNTEEGVALLPAERTSMPSREHEGAYPGERSGGVGALPGHFNESSVAVLPEERVATQTNTGVDSSAHAATLHSSERSDKRDIKAAVAHPIETAKHEKSSGVGASSGHFNESNVGALPGERATHTNAGVESSAHTTAHPTAHPTSDHVTAHPTSDHVAAHPTSEHTDKGDVKTAAAHPIQTAKQARRNSVSSSSSSEGEQDPNAPKQKTSLKNKIAGSMKKAMGKMKKDEEMVAEGEAQRGH